MIAKRTKKVRSFIDTFSQGVLQLTRRNTWSGPPFHEGWWDFLNSVWNVHHEGLMIVGEYQSTRR